MGPVEIAVICAGKAAFLALLAKAGLLPERGSEQSAKPGPASTPYAGATLEMFTDADGKVWTVHKRADGKGLSTMRPAKRKGQAQP